MKLKQSVKLSTSDNKNYYNTKFFKNQQKNKENGKFIDLAKTFVYFSCTFAIY